MSMSSLSSLSDEEEEDQEPVPAIPRIPDRVDLFAQHNGEEFRIRYRISKRALLQIEKHISLQPLTRRNKPIDSITQLLICLRYFATGSCLDVIADLPNIHKSTICRVIQKVTMKLAELAPIYIKMPQKEELAKVADDFYQIGGFPRVAGALGCTLIKIISRGGMLSEAYRCRKGYYAINVQAVCDAKLKITNLIVRWPGSVDDCTIFENSSLCTDFENGKYGNYLLLGDNGYYNKNYLMTPFSQPLSNAEEAYNQSQLATRYTIDRCFDAWKRRCPCLEKGISLKKTETVLQVIVASAVLHNMCINLNETEMPNDYEPNVEYCPENSFVFRDIGETSQTSLRTALVNTVFA